MHTETLVAGCDLRVLCGDDAEVREVKRGEPWPHDARARLDPLIRVGHVVRFDEHGVPDKRSRRFVRKLGLPTPTPEFKRTFIHQARASVVEAEIHGRMVRVFLGRDAAELRDLVAVGGRAYVLRRGAPDGPTAVGAPRVSTGVAHNAPGRRPASRATKAQKGEKTSKKRRRRKSSGS